MHESCLVSGADRGCARLQRMHFSNLESVKLISRRSNKTSFSFITVTKCCCKSIKMYSSNSIFPWRLCLKKYQAISSILCMFDGRISNCCCGVWCLAMSTGACPAPASSRKPHQSLPVYLEKGAVIWKVVRGEILLLDANNCPGY